MITVTPGGKAQPELLWGGALNWAMSEVPVAVAGAHPLVVLADEVLRWDGLGTSLWSLQGLSTEPRLLYRAPAGELLRLLGVTSSDELPQAVALITRAQETLLATISVAGQVTEYGTLPTDGAMVSDASWGSGLLALVLDDSCGRLLIVRVSGLAPVEPAGDLALAACPNDGSRRLVELSPNDAQVAIVNIDDRRLSTFDLSSGDELHRVGIEGIPHAFDFDGWTALVATDVGVFNVQLTTPGVPTTTIPVDDEILALDLIQDVTNSATHQVTGVARDDVLNVREEPNSNALLRAELPATYSGLRWTGTSSVADDTGVWWLVELTKPVALLNLGEPLHGGPALGWINSAFVEPISDGLTEDCHLEGNELNEPVSSERPVLAGTTALQLAECSRIVMDFVDLDSDWHSETAPENPAYGPSAVGVIADGQDFEIGLGSVQVFSVELPPLTLSPPAMFVDSADGPVLRVLGAVSDWGLWVDGRNRLVLDYVATPSSPPFRMIEGIGLIDPPSEATSGETITFRGLGTVFESWINASLRDAINHLPVVATFTQGGVNEHTSSFLVTAGVGLPADFEFSVDGLKPGRYELVLVGQGSHGPIHRFEVRS
ncbi:MAG: hypothetical protein ACR2ME_06425 [Acidimicrobiia bacterium]